MDIQLQFLNEWMNLADFLHDNTYLEKLKVTLILIGWLWANMGVPFQVMGLYNLLYLKNKLISRKLNITLGMHMVKYSCDDLGPGTLKSILTQE